LIAERGLHDQVEARARHLHAHADGILDERSRAAPGLERIQLGVAVHAGLASLVNAHRPVVEHLTSQPPRDEEHAQIRAVIEL
jgi:hypothetical protein